jgi:hypothetical protein
LFSASSHRKPLLDHLISSIWVKWKMITCYEGYVWLILVMPCPLGTVAGPKFGRFQLEPIHNQSRLFAASTHRKPLPDHFIS